MRRARHGPDPRRRGEVLVGPEHLSRRWHAPLGSAAASTRSSSAAASCCRSSRWCCPPNLREPVAASLRRTVVAPLVRLQQQRGTLARRVARSASATTLRRDSLALARAAAPDARVENDRLRELLGLGSALQWGSFPPRRCSDAERGEDCHDVTLTAGIARRRARAQPRRRAGGTRRHGVRRSIRR